MFFLMSDSRDWINSWVIFRAVVIASDARSERELNSSVLQAIECVGVRKKANKKSNPNNADRWTFC